jgi:hypothetical protein
MRSRTVKSGFHLPRTHVCTHCHAQLSVRLESGHCVPPLFTPLESISLTAKSARMKLVITKASLNPGSNAHTPTPILSLPCGTQPRPGPRQPIAGLQTCMNLNLIRTYLTAIAVSHGRCERGLDRSRLSTQWKLEQTRARCLGSVFTDGRTEISSHHSGPG